MSDCWKEIAKFCTWPSRKLANGLPVPVTPGQIAAHGAECEVARGPWGLDHVEPFPAPVEAHLHGVPALQPGQRIGDFRDARVEVRRGAHRRPDLLITVGSEGGHRVGETPHSRGSPECSARCPLVKAVALRPDRRCDACLRHAAHSGGCPRMSADNLRRTPRHRVFCGPMATLPAGIVPLPSGNAVTGTASPWK